MERQSGGKLEWKVQEDTGQENRTKEEIWRYAALTLPLPFLQHSTYNPIRFRFDCYFVIGPSLTSSTDAIENS
jgi:hypothetical protein